jgi:hypothetical protein
LEARIEPIRTREFGLCNPGLASKVGWQSR